QDHRLFAVAIVAEAHRAAGLVAEQRVERHLGVEFLVDADFAQRRRQLLLGRGRAGRQRGRQQTQEVRLHGAWAAFPLGCGRTVTPCAAANAGSDSSCMARSTGICTTPAWRSTQAYLVSFASSSLRWVSMSRTSKTCKRGAATLPRFCGSFVRSFAASGD